MFNLKLLPLKVRCSRRIQQKVIKFQTFSLLRPFGAMGVAQVLGSMTSVKVNSYSNLT